MTLVWASKISWSSLFFFGFTIEYYSSTKSLSLLVYLSFSLSPEIQYSLSSEIWHAALSNKNIMNPQQNCCHPPSPTHPPLLCFGVYISPWILTSTLRRLAKDTFRWHWFSFRLGPIWTTYQCHQPKATQPDQFDMPDMIIKITPGTCHSRHQI